MKKEKDEKQPKLYMSDLPAMHQHSEFEIANQEENTGMSTVDELFSNDTMTESAILKELFNNRMFKVKTELSDFEISVVSRIYLLAVLTKRPDLRKVVDEFLVLRISKDRQSRKEFVEANKDMKKEMPGGFFNRMLGGG